MAKFGEKRGEGAYIPILRKKTPLLRFPGKRRAPIVEHAVCDLCSDIESQDVEEVDAAARAGGEAFHLLFEGDPGGLLDEGKELGGFEADLAPG